MVRRYRRLGIPGRRSFCSALYGLRDETGTTPVTVDFTTIASNLSFVLHERSDSPVVEQYAKMLQRERSKREEAVRRLQQISQEQLVRRIVHDQTHTEDHAPEVQRVEVVSVMVGVWEILPWILRATGLLPDGLSPNFTMLDSPFCARRKPRLFFRGEASLCVPTKPPSPKSRWIFAAAFLRPGNETVLLRHVHITPGATDLEAAWSVVTANAEAAIREFVLQWSCSRSLWTRPIEETLPEFT